MSRLVPSLTAFLLAMCGSAGAFTSGNFLDVSVTCPSQAGNGVLERISENPEGNQSRATYIYKNGRLEKITVAHSEDGTVFKELFSLDRASSEATKEAPAFHGFEGAGNELFRFYCFAEPEAKARYLGLLRANREILRQDKGG